MASPTAQTSLDNAKGATVGLAVDFTVAKKDVSCVVFTSGLVTGGIVSIEASHDSLNWVPMGSLATADGRASSLDFSRGAYRYWRASILDPIKGGGTVSATFMEAN